MAENTPKKPNVLVFFTDQQRWDTTGVHGNPLDLTPNFDRVAKRGTHFANAITCNPVCGPARSSMQTGTYPTQTGCFRNSIPLDEEATTLAKCFKKGGYETGYIGKWHLGGGNLVNKKALDPVPEEKRGGYDYWLASDLLEFTSDAYDTILFNNDNEPVKLPGYRVDALTDAAIRYIDTQKDNPFFLFLSFLEPHHQNHRDDYPGPHGHESKYVSKWLPPDLAALGGTSHQHLPGYCAMIKRLDEAFGRVLDALRSLHLLDDTIILFTSDHGSHFKTRNSEYKRSCHESSVHIPAAARGPGFDGGGEIRELVSLVDFAPSLLDAAGLEIPSEMVGKSVMPLTKGDNSNWPDSAFIQISEEQVGRAIRTSRWKYSVVAEGIDGREEAGADTYTEEFLYDLKADPYELENLVGEEAYEELRECLRERLLRSIRGIEGRDVTIKPSAERESHYARNLTQKELDEVAIENCTVRGFG